MPMQRAVAGEAVPGDVIEILRADGGRIAVFAKAMPLFDEEGQTRGAVGAFVDITKIKAAEAALRESEQRFRRLVESYAQAVWETGPDGVPIKDNPTWRAYTGQSLEEFFERGWADAIHPDDRAEAEAQWRKAVTERLNFDAEYRLKSKDGGWRWTNVRATPILDRDGSILKWTGMNIDVDARKQAEDALREREERQAFLLNLSDALRPVSDADEIEATACRMVGEKLGADRVVYADVEDGFFVPRQNYTRGVPPLVERTPVAAFGSAFLDCYRKGETVVVRDVGADPRLEEAERRTLEAGRIGAFIRVTLSKQGRWAGSFCAHQTTPRAWTEAETELLREVAERLWSAAERARVQTALRESELRLQLALDSGNIGIHEWRIADGELIWDDRLRAQWGLQPGAPTSFEVFMRGVHPADRDMVQSAIDRALDPSSGGSLYCEYRVLGLTDEVERWIAATGLVFFTQGRATRLVGTAQDITERKRVEEALKAADRRKDEFLATLAHELRNPLAPIRNAIHVLRHDARSTLKEPRDLTLLAMIERQVDHLIRLVDDLLEVSRITRGKIDLKKEDLDLRDVLRHAVETAGPSIERGGHSLVVDLCPESLIVNGDPVRLSQVFTNLLNNAAKYTEHGGSVSLAAERRGGEAVVTVRDSGVGIPTEMLPRVFDLFTQVDRSLGRAQGGLGIGLALVRSLLQLHGGTVEAQSEGLGRGSAFIVRLPALGQFVAEIAMRDSSGQSRETPSRRVLVVDDDHDVADSLAMFLETFGAEVRVAYSGAEGVEALGAFRPELVFLDLGMPGMDGYETARRMRALPEGRDVAMVALTGWGQEQVYERARDAGFDRQLTKPAGLEAIQELLGSL
jgi:PAS domain S-box-containing protein